MFRNRVRKELALLMRDPCPGITVWVKDEADIMNMEAHVEGPADSPYVGGLFLLSVRVPVGYPLEPPHLQFITPIFHPNIDSDGRICLDTLKPQPQGSWSPASSLHTVLLSVRLLMGYPNAADGLSPTATELYKRDLMQFRAVAVEHTRTHAMTAPAGAAAALSTATGSSGGGGGERGDSSVAVAAAAAPPPSATATTTVEATMLANTVGAKRPMDEVTLGSEGSMCISSDDRAGGIRVVIRKKGGGEILGSRRL
jgi:ubiquitin-conjugating enzyme E2 T